MRFAILALLFYSELIILSKLSDNNAYVYFSRNITAAIYLDVVIPRKILTISARFRNNTSREATHWGRVRISFHKIKVETRVQKPSLHYARAAALR